MTLIKSISGIRGTVGGVPEVNLTPLDIVRFTSAYGKWIKENNTGDIMDLHWKRFKDFWFNVSLIG